MEIGKACILCVLALPETRLDGKKIYLCRYDFNNFKEIGSSFEVENNYLPTWCPVKTRKTSVSRAKKTPKQLAVCDTPSLDT
jgi:hypothetical protein